MYKVVYGFIDSVEKRDYKTGDAFVVGPKTDDKRIRSLSGYDNAIGRPLIVEIEDEPLAPVEIEPVDEPQAPAEVEIVEEITPIEDVKPLSEWTIAELKEVATARGIEFKVKSTKSELIAMLNGE